jgi:gluconolactonase
VEGIAISVLNMAVTDNGQAATNSITQELPEAPYYLTPDQKSLTGVVDDLQKPNGLIGTPGGQGNKTYAYDIQDDGTLKNKRLICNLGSDGMTIDSAGNLYLTGSSGMTVFDKTGQQIGKIKVPQSWTGNVCFGGADRQTLFITASTAIYGLQMVVKGVGSQ